MDDARGVADCCADALTKRPHPGESKNAAALSLPAWKIGMTAVLDRTVDLDLRVLRWFRLRTTFRALDG